MRYVFPAFQESTLRRGASLEQFMGAAMRDGERTISYLEIRPAKGGFEVWRFEAPDIGDKEFTDVSEFAFDGENEPLATLQHPSDAFLFAHSQLGADPQRWVNIGVVCDEYKDYVMAGRPVRT